MLLCASDLQVTVEVAMYARKIRNSSEKWKFVLQRWKCCCSSNCREYSSYRTLSHKKTVGKYSSHCNLIRIYAPGCFSPSGIASERWYTSLDGRSDAPWRSSQLRFYSSEGDERNTSQDRYPAVQNGTNPDMDNIRKEKHTEDTRHCDAHARLGVQDQKEWLNNEKLAIESKKKESPFLSRRERFKNEFLRRVVPWEKITVSWDSFPYFVQ